MKYSVLYAAFLSLCLTTSATLTNSVLTIDLSNKTVVASSTIAIRETINVALVNIGASSPTNLVLRVVRETNAYANATNFTAAGTDSNGNVMAFGPLDLNTSELVNYYEGLNPTVSRQWSLAVWDTSLGRLLVNDYVDIQNNPYAESMPGPSPVGVVYVATTDAVYANSVTGFTYTTSGNTGAIGKVANHNVAITFPSPQSATGAVISVNGKDGVVVLTTSDIDEGINLYYTAARVTTHPFVVAQILSNALYESRIASNLALINSNAAAQRLTNEYFESAKTNIQDQMDDAINRIAATEGYTNMVAVAFGWGDWSIYGFLTNESLWIAKSNAVVYTNNPALTDARIPLAHDQGWTTITGIPTTVAGYGIVDAATGGPVYVESDPVLAGVSNTIVYTNDIRLTNSRPPDAHDQALATITNAGTMAAASTDDYYTAVETGVLLDEKAPTNDLTAHTTNTVLHVSAGDRTNWDGKATLADVAEAGYITNAGSISHTNLTDINSGLDAQHLTAAEKGVATNNLIPRLAVVESWGDWNNEGFLKNTTNIFTSIYAADRSQLGANLTSLTSATGSLTSVSFTNAVSLVVGRTYLYGFTFANYGTGTLSVAGNSIIRTTAGSSSNYFTYHSGESSNLVIKLDGTGSGIGNASGIFCQQITGGVVSVAGNLDVGGTMVVNGETMTNPAAHIAATSGVHGLDSMAWKSTNDYTNTVALAAAAYPAGDPSNYQSQINGKLSTNGVNGTNTIGSIVSNGQVIVVGTNTPWTASGYLTNETYLGTITGMTVTESTNASSVTTNGGVFALNVRTNSGGGAGTITNMANDPVTSIVWSASGGPQPIGSITSYVAGVAATKLGTNDISVTNARSWDAPNYNTITNPPIIPTNAGQVNAVSNNVAGIAAAGGLVTNNVFGTNTTGTIVSNGQVNVVGTNTPWTALGYTNNTVTNGVNSSLTNHVANGNANSLHLTGPQFLFATQSTVVAMSTNMGWFTLTGTTWIYCSYSDAAILAATNSLNTRMGNVEGATGSLNTAVSILNTNTFPKQSGLSVSNDMAIIKTNYFPLQSGLNVSNRVGVLDTNTFLKTDYAGYGVCVFTGVDANTGITNILEYIGKKTAQ